jgi:hypothetical protein
MDKFWKLLEELRVQYQEGLINKQEVLGKILITITLNISNQLKEDEVREHCLESIERMIDKSLKER